MTCLEKDRNRRYETASALAQDVEHFLNDEAVKARPPSTWYRLRKFSRRNRAAVAIVATVLTCLLFLTVGSLVNTALLLSERERTQRAAAESKAVANFLSNVIMAPYHAGMRNRQMTVFEALAREETKIATSFKDQPLMDAQVRKAFGFSYWGLGAYDRAAAHLRRAMELRTELLGAQDPETLGVTDRLAIVLVLDNKYEEARQVCEKAIEVTRRELGPEHVGTLSAMKSLIRIFIYADELMSDTDVEYAQKLCEETLELARRVLGSEHVQTLGTAYDLAVILRMHGRNEVALKLFQETLAVNRRVFGPHHFMTMHLMREEANTLSALGRAEEAELKLLAALEALRAVEGDRHWWTLDTKLELAHIKGKLGRHEEAIRLYEEVLEISRRHYDSKHTTTLQSMRELAWYLATVDCAKFRNGQRALVLAGEACTLTEYEDPYALDALAASNAEMGNFEAAVKWSTKALDLVKSKRTREEFVKHLESFQARRPWREALQPRRDLSPILAIP
jgi:tetratricopeptide (TPR) repeat protein